MADDYSLNDDGTITFEFDNVTRIMRRPTLRQYREAIERLGSARDAALPATSDAENPIPINIQFDVIVKWLDETLKDLAGEGLPRAADGTIDEDVLPAWLLSGELIADVIKHWGAVPSHRGGR